MTEKEPQDPLGETRKNREELFKQFDYDLDKLCEYIKKEQSENKVNKIVTKDDLEKAG